MNNFLLKFMANWPAKVLAVIMALFLYVFQQMNNVTGVNIDIPLTGNENAELVATTTLPDKVRLTISGTDADIAAVREQNISAAIDISVYTKPGTYNVPVKLQSAEGTRSLDLLNMIISPAEIKLVLDQRAGKYVFVEPAIKGEAAPGYALTRYIVTPTEIYVEGPAALVNQIESLRTEVIDITGRNTNLDRTVKVAGLQSLLHIYENTVQFSAFIASIEEIKEYTDIAIGIKNLESPFELDLANENGSIHVRGNTSALTDYAPQENTLTLDFSQIIKAGLYIMPVVVSVPEDITLLGYEPETVTVRVQVKTEP